MAYGTFRCTNHFVKNIQAETTERQRKKRNKPEKSHSCTVLVIIQCVIFLVKAFSCFPPCQEVPVLKRTWENKKKTRGKTYSVQIWQMHYYCLCTVSCFSSANWTVWLNKRLLSHSSFYDTFRTITMQRVSLFLLLLSFQVENPSKFIQGYRVLYRQTSGLPSPGPWQIQDLKVASERDITLSGLKKGIVYEIKVRPYFNEFQGADSESMTARTMEEGEPQINSHFW